MGRQVIEWRDYGYSYAGSDQDALTGLSLSVEKGDFVLLCGKSGSGKTTLLRNLKPELTPAGVARGHILIEGKEGMTPLESARKLGYVMQEPENQIVMDSVWQELAFGMENLALPPEEIGRRIGEIAGFFGITGWFERSVFQLSGGQKQILNLASVIAMQADIILLDEPVARLDPIAAKEFLQMVTRVNTELGKTILISEHRIDDVLSVCDKVLYLEKGTISFYGSNRAFPGFLSDRSRGGDDFTIALPAPARLSMACRPGGSHPLDVKEGRAWLEQTTENFRFSVRNGPAAHDAGASVAAPSASPPAAHDAAPSASPPENTSLRGAPTTKSAPQAREIALHAKGLWYRYDKDQDFVTKGLEIKAGAGRIHAIIGGNGSGKSTLLALLCGLYKPHRGKVDVSGGRKRVLLPQEPMSVFVCDRLRDDLKEHKPDITDEAVETVAARLGLSELLDRHPYDLSGGEAQKAALAKVLLLEPEILLLDEPVKGLDAFARRDLGHILKGLADEGVTIIMVTHDLEFAAAWANDCSMVFGAAVIASGAGRDFFNNNMFYTTSMNRMTRGILEGCILMEDLIWEKR